MPIDADFEFNLDEILDMRDAARNESGGRFKSEMLVDFRRWLVGVDAYANGIISDRMLARVFGVHHRLVGQARRGARWQARNPLLFAWIASVDYFESAPVQSVVEWDAAIRRGERLSVSDMIDEAMRAAAAEERERELASEASVAAPAPVADAAPESPPSSAPTAAGDAAVAEIAVDIDEFALAYWGVGTTPAGESPESNIVARGRMASGVAVRAATKPRQSPAQPQPQAPRDRDKPAPPKTADSGGDGDQRRPAAPISMPSDVSRAPAPQAAPAPAPKSKGLFGRLRGKRPG